MPQFPLDMGRKDASASGKTLGVTLGNDGNIKYDAILRQGQNKDKLIASEHSALVPKIDREVWHAPQLCSMTCPFAGIWKPQMGSCAPNTTEKCEKRSLSGSSATVQAVERPDEDEVAKATRETRAALDRLVEGKISAAQPKTLPAGPGAPQYIKYTPSQQGPQYNSGAGQRIIRMQVRLPSSLSSNLSCAVFGPAVLDCSASPLVISSFPVAARSLSLELCRVTCLFSWGVHCT